MAALGSSALTLAQQGAWGDTKDGIPYRILGKTGEKVSLLGIGGFHMGDPGEKEGIAIVRTALDRGVNFLDNCWDYHDGLSEERMGRALRDGYRKRAFLMTKIDGRNEKTAARQIDESLARLQTDHIDLMQFHEIIRDSDHTRIFAPDGAVKAMLAAKKAGKIRYIGFTGHKSPAYHLEMLATAEQHGLHFDAVQLPLNIMDAHFDSFAQKVIPVLVGKQIAILGMKPFGGGYILKSGAPIRPVECLHYAMNLPTSVVITGCDSIKILEQGIAAAQSFQPMNDQAVAALLAKTAPYASEGKHEKYKVSERFDGTTKHPEWLG